MVLLVLYMVLPEVFYFIMSIPVMLVLLVALVISTVASVL
jgi:hypothetical protein